MTGTVLVVVLADQVHARRLATRIAAMAVLFVHDAGHPAATTTGCAAELAVGSETSSDQLLPSRVHAIVLVSKMHKPTLRALAYARATRPSLLEAVTVNVDAGRDQGAAGGVGPPRHPGAAEDPGLAVPRDHPPGRRLRQGGPPRQPARRRHRLHPRVRRRRTGGSSCCTTRARCGSRPGCCSRPVSWWPACRGSCARPRAARPGSTAADGRVGAAGPVSRRHEPADATAARRGVPGRHRLRGGGRPGRPRRPLRRPPRRPGRLRPPHAAGRARPRPGHPRAGGRPVPARRRRRGARGVPRPASAAVPLLRSRPLRRVRLAARRPGRPARAQGRRRQRAAAPAGRAGRLDVDGRAGAGRRRRAALAHPGASSRSTPRAGPGLRRHRSPRGRARSTTASSPPERVAGSGGCSSADVARRPTPWTSSTPRPASPGRRR